MYLSHPVRRIRDDPDPDATVALVIELTGDGDATEHDPLESLSVAVADDGGRIVRDLGFDCHLVVVPEPTVETLCALDGIERIETDATVSRSFETSTAEPVEDTGTTAETLREHVAERSDR
ncbi:hypothetical protein [Halorubrum vacuolatum]|uniref:Putative peptidase inhibitor domain-containing protein n=1 Tax=Halorubrum vacuolatum TaxID=63740 RepID=A0A238WV47_HALVU|nr:hypothetical protein [Halorubrum vacuolatum]SNR50400.1 hypothetical protein SAMN06264855_11088 [Halorubrum vacuolatum]